MTSEQIVRSWKDEEYFLALSDEDLALIPENPAGWVELSDADLLGVAGGTDTVLLCIGLITSVAISVTVTVSSAIVTLRYCGR